MKATLFDVCREISLEFAARLKTTFPVNQREPHVRCLVGQCVVLPDLIHLLPSGLLVPEDGIWTAAEIQADPMAALLGQNPIKREYVASFTHIALTVGVKEALSETAWHHPTVQILGAELFQLGVKTCQVNDFAGNQDLNPRKYATLLGRLRKHRRLLETDFCSGTTFSDKINSAIFHLPKARKTSYHQIGIKRVEVSYFTKYDFHPQIIPRSPHSWEKEIIRRAKVPKAAAQRYLRVAKEFEIGEANDIPSKRELHRYAQAEIRNKRLWPNAREAWSIPYPLPASQGLGSAELHEFLLQIVKLDTTEQLVWAWSAFCFCQLKADRLKDFVMVPYKGFFYAEHIIRPPQKAASLSLHRARTAKFWVPIPNRLALRIPEISGAYFDPQLIVRAKDWARVHFPRITPARLATALVTIGCHNYGLPWVLAHSCLYPNRQKVPAPRSYVALSEQLLPPCQHFFRLIDSGYTTPEFTPNVLAGSGLTPKPEIVREFFKDWRTLFERQIPESHSVQELIDDWNAIGAGAKHAQILIAGLRAYELPPHLQECSTLGEAHQQKGVFVTAICNELERIFDICERKRLDYERAIQQQGLAFNRKHPGGPCSMMMPEEDGLYYYEPKARHVTAAFLVSPELARYAGLHPNAMRHFAATTLREASIDEVEARMFLGHQPRCLASLSVYGTNLAAVRSLRIELATLLGRKAGLWV